MSAFKKLAVGHPAVAAEQVFEDKHPDLLKSTNVLKNEKELKKFCMGKTFEGGVEHCRHWIPAIANANMSGSNVKAHVLRFLGMYNVVDLLVFTIGMQFLLEQKKEEFKENWYDLFVCFFCFSETNFQTFAKAPGVNKMLMMVNDFSILSFNFLAMGTIVTMLKFALDENKFDIRFEITRAVILAPLALYMFHSQFAKGLPLIVLSTHYAMYSPGWALRWDQQSIFEYLARVIQANTTGKGMMP
ncbi:hypothetical protein TL16_g06182 [Triparma laevis f. inornata]|uniref:Uncharacterized protein n=1 Tax=Triparma laevis f. inornata TaxID=1714386 RepID=A0A9W7AIE7_9STRA|nr:hypothetical protein TL16_g06182 [Triparma laevis f. inornata]